MQKIIKLGTYKDYIYEQNYPTYHMPALSCDIYRMPTGRCTDERKRRNCLTDLKYWHAGFANFGH